MANLGDTDKLVDQPRGIWPVTRILIADDHQVVRLGLRTILEDQPGFEIVGEAENGQEG